MKVKIAIIGEIDADKFPDVQKKMKDIVSNFNSFTESWELRKGIEK